MINVCSSCGLRGYEFADADKCLCKSCVSRLKDNCERAAELKRVFSRFVERDMKAPWRYCEFGKAMIGNSLIAAIKVYEPNWRPFADAANRDGVEHITPHSHEAASG
jgi:hypothetical protein